VTSGYGKILDMAICPADCIDNKHKGKRTMKLSGKTSPALFGTTPVFSRMAQMYINAAWINQEYAIVLRRRGPRYLMNRLKMNAPNTNAIIDAPDFAQRHGEDLG
jgi:hypothetical protein